MAVITYSYAKDKNKKLTPHFSVGEFRSYNSAKGKLTTDTIKIDEELPKTLEKIFSKLNCSKIIVTSGFRTPAFERELSGKTTGQHVNGKAADIICYDQKGAKIDPKKVCIAAQELNVTGIGYMNGGTHIDVRAWRSWFDETKGNKLVTDWKKYFGVAPVKKSGITTLKLGNWKVHTRPSLGAPTARIVSGIQSVTYVDIVNETDPKKYGDGKFYKLRDGTYLSTKACK